jgi:hypothetical protein
MREIAASAISGVVKPVPTDEHLHLLSMVAKDGSSTVNSN